MSTTTVPAVELLDVDNYATWRSKMKFPLITKDLWTAVEGETVNEQTDAKALAQIGLHVKDHHLPELENCATAKAAWERLGAIYQTKSNARKRQLRKELTQLKMGAAEPLTKYVGRAKDIQNQLRAAGYEVADQEVIWAMLAGLPLAYDTVVTVLETSADQDLKLDDVLPKLMPVEQRLTKTESSLSEATALTANRKYGFGGNIKETRTCYYCGKVGHVQRACRQRKLDEASGGRSVKMHNAIAL